MYKYIRYARIMIGPEPRTMYQPGGQGTTWYVTYNLKF